jgi:class 3 adenylate cyclase
MTGRLKYFLLIILGVYGPLRVIAQVDSPGNKRIDSLLTNMHAQEDDTNKVVSLNELSNAYHTSSPYDGIKYGREALALSEELQWEKGIAQSNNSLGINYYALANYSDAYSHWEKALRIHQKIDYKPGIANQLQNIGNIFFSQGDDQKALEYYQDALKKYEELGNTTAITHCYTAIGNVYATQKDYQKALEYHLKSLKIHEEQHLSDDRAADLMNIGAVYSDNGQCDKALEYLFKALEIKKMSGDRNGIARTDGIIGKTFLRIANDPARNAATADSSTSGRAKNAQQAIAYLDSAIDIDEEIGFLDDLQKNSRYLSEADEIMGNYKEALSSYKRYAVLKDSIYSAVNMAKIFNTERKEEIAAKDNEIRNKQEQHKYFIGGIISLFIIIVLLGVVIRFIFRNYAVQKTLNGVITVEKKKSEDLLLNILPPEVADELKEKGRAEAKLFDNVTVLFTDFVNFTKVSERLSPKELVDELNVCFSAFDRIMDKYDIEKIKTIGDAYHAVSGLPLATPFHAEYVLDAALDIRDFINERIKQLGDRTFEIRIGIHSGSVVAGIVGVKKFTYDIWGDTVNTAARMEQCSESGKINISQTTYELVKDKFSCTWRGMIEAKNKGEMGMYFVEAKFN